MARVLFINAGSEGHINPTIGVVQELIRRGEEVVYFVADPFRNFVEPTGAKVITCDGGKFLAAFLAGGRNPWARISGLLRTADIVIPSVLEQTKGEHFDYIIHDSMFGCGRLLAQILDLPAVNSCTSFAFQQSIFDHLQEYQLRQFPADANERAYQEFQQLVGQVQTNYGVQIGSAFEVQCNPAPLTIVYTSRRFQPGGESFNESYKFVGPSIAPRSKLNAQVHTQMDSQTGSQMGSQIGIQVGSRMGFQVGSQDEFDFSQVDTDNLIYISLGTVFNQAVDFYRLCFAAFTNTKYTVILSIGGQTQIAELGEIPANFIVRNYVPQLEVLQHAKLFITHGGMNSTSEGLYYGVPLIVIPQGADQPMIARRVAESSAGIHLNQAGLTEGELREAAERVQKDESIQEACARIGDSFRAAGGHQRAVEEIFAYKRSLGIMN